MKLFSLNGDPIRFNLIDIEPDECSILEELIRTSGGDITDDEESIVKFTSKEAFGKIKYPRAKIYNVDFILGCIQHEKIIDPEPFRLSSKIPGDEYHMEHFLFGRCACNRSGNAEGIDASSVSQQPTRMVNDSQASVETDSTMFTAMNEPSSPFVEESLDESQMVVTAADLKICVPTLAGGDAAKARMESHEKRPCNVEYELEVQPKMAALEREATRMAAAKESNVENRQLQRSLRTRTRRNHTARTGALQEKNSIDSEDSDVGNVHMRRESVSIDLQNCPTPKKMVRMEVLSSPEAQGSPKPQLSPPRDSRWTETKQSVPKVVSNVVIPPASAKKLTKIPAEGSKLLNICYKGLKPAAGTVKSPGEPVLSKAPKRKHSYEKSSDEASASKRNEKNEKRGSIEPTKSASKRNRRKGEAESSEDEAKVSQKMAKHKPQITYSNGDGRSKNKPKGWVQESSEEEDEEEEEEEEESSHKSSNSTRKIKGMRKLYNPREKQKSSKTSRKDSPRSSRKVIDPVDSSDFSVNFSSEEEVPKKKRSRRKEVASSDSSNLIISDDSEKEDNPRKQRNNDLNKPGPSGIPKVKSEFYCDDDDDESTDDNLNETPRRYNRPEKAGDCKQIVAIKTESYSTAGKSRGQVWRSQLVDKSADIHIRHGPFTAGERTTMVNYLVRTRTVNKAKGLVIWKAMIDDGFLTHRTPQSLQNHFKKVILPHIEDCSGLKAEDRKKFLLLRTEKTHERFRK